MNTRTDPSRVIRAPRGTTLHGKNWLTEAAYRMIQNNLDPEVAENPQSLVVASAGWAWVSATARAWPSTKW